MRRLSIFLFVILFFSSSFAQWGVLPWDFLEENRTKIRAFEESSARKWTVFQVGNSGDKIKVKSLEKDIRDGAITVLNFAPRENSSSSLPKVKVEAGIRVKRVRGAYRIEEVYATDSLQFCRYFSAFSPDIGFGRELPLDTLIVDSMPPKGEMTRTDLQKPFGRWVFLRDTTSPPIRFEYNYSRNRGPVEFVGMDKSDSLLIEKCCNGNFSAFFPARNETVWVMGIDELDGFLNVRNRWVMELNDSVVDDPIIFHSEHLLRNFSISYPVSFQNAIEIEEFDFRTGQIKFEKVFFNSEKYISRFDLCVPGIGTSRVKIDFQRNEENLIKARVIRSGQFSRKKWDAIIKEGLPTMINYYSEPMDLFCGVPKETHTFLYDDFSRLNSRIVSKNQCFPKWNSETYKTTRYALHYEYNDQNLVERIYRQSLDTNYVAPGEPHPKVLYQFSEFEWEE